MNGSRYYGVRVEGAKFGVGFGSALAITISYTENHSILWAIIDGILSWLYVVYFALFRDDTAFPINSKTTQARQGVGNPVWKSVLVFISKFAAGHAAKWIALGR